NPILNDSASKLYPRPANSPPTIQLPCLIGSSPTLAEDCGLVSTVCACAPIAKPPNKRHKKVSLDRKSTRLNSSHVKISYAVYCYSHHQTLHSFPTRRSSDLNPILNDSASKLYPRPANSPPTIQLPCLIGSSPTLAEDCGLVSTVCACAPIAKPPNKRHKKVS